jgi:hypothetical protein
MAAIPIGRGLMRFRPLFGGHSRSIITALTPAPRLKELVLVRHGESEGNIAHKRSLRGDHALYENVHFARRHSSHWRLTNRGIEEAIKAGEWLRTNLDTNFDRFYVSEYVRAMETAAKLNFTNATWFAETFLRERDLGIFDLMSHAERRQRFAEELKRRERDRCARHLCRTPSGLCWPCLSPFAAPAVCPPSRRERDAPARPRLASSPPRPLRLDKTVVVRRFHRESCPQPQTYRTF